jgi:hypothetical protein
MPRLAAGLARPSQGLRSTTLFKLFRPDLAPENWTT